MAGREDPLTEYELRVVRGMIDEYRQRRYRDQWFDSAWKRLAAVVGALAGVAIITSAVIQIIQAATGG